MSHIDGLLPQLVLDKDYSEVPDWPLLHVWNNGTVIVQEQKHILLWDPTIDQPLKWRRYEWAALSEFPRHYITVRGLEAIKFILNMTEENRVRNIISEFDRLSSSETDT